MSFCFNRSAHLVVLLLTLLTSRLPTAVSLGARRQYHSYHHLSQNNTNNTRTLYKQNKPSAQNLSRRRSSLPNSKSSTSMSIQDETEMLLERAAKLRALAAQRQVELASLRVNQGDQVAY